MITLTILALLLGASASAQPLMCKSAPRTIRRIPLQKTPNYFFKISPDGRYLFYIAEGRNWVRDLVTGKESAILGTADPVPSVDGKVLTFLSKESSGWKVGAAQLSRPFDISTPKHVKWAGMADGSYQSVGPVLPDGVNRQFLYFDERKNQIVLRHLTDTGSGLTLGPAHSSITDPGLRLPMMSPDGKFLSVLNTRLNKTQIYSLSSNPIQAKLVDTLPFAAGKASFSYDNKKLTFHLTKTFKKVSADVRYPAVLGSDDTLRNVYVYDLATKKATQVTDNSIFGSPEKNKDSYFPVFLGDGRVAYIDRNDAGEFSLEFSTIPSAGEARNYDKVAACLGESPNTLLTQLADQWAKLCGRWTDSLEDGGISLAQGLRMSPGDCTAIVRKVDDPEMVKLCQALVAADLNKTDTPRNAETKEDPEEIENQGKKLYQNRCAICHEGDQTRIAGSTELARVLKGEDADRMPPSGKLLTGDEQETLKKYLLQFMKKKK